MKKENWGGLDEPNDKCRYKCKYDGKYYNGIAASPDAITAATGKTPDELAKEISESFKQDIMREYNLTEEQIENLLKLE